MQKKNPFAPVIREAVNRAGRAAQTAETLANAPVDASSAQSVGAIDPGTGTFTTFGMLDYTPLGSFKLS